MKVWLVLFVVLIADFYGIFGQTTLDDGVEGSGDDEELALAFIIDGSPKEAIVADNEEAPLEGTGDNGEPLPIIELVEEPAQASLVEAQDTVDNGEELQIIEPVDEPSETTIAEIDGAVNNDGELTIVEAVGESDQTAFIETGNLAMLPDIGFLQPLMVAQVAEDAPTVEEPHIAASLFIPGVQIFPIDESPVEPESPEVEMQPPAAEKQDAQSDIQTDIAEVEKEADETDTEDIEEKEEEILNEEINEIIEQVELENENDGEQVVDVKPFAIGVDADNEIKVLDLEDEQTPLITGLAIDLFDPENNEEDVVAIVAKPVEDQEIDVDNAAKAAEDNNLDRMAESEQKTVQTIKLTAFPKQASQGLLPTRVNPIVEPAELSTKPRRRNPLKRRMRKLKTAIINVMPEGFRKTRKGRKMFRELRRQLI